MQVQESRESAPSGYTLTGHANPDTVLTLKLALTQSDSDGLINALYNVSTPSSAKYGQYLTAQEVCTGASMSWVAPSLRANNTFTSVAPRLKHI